MSLPLRPPLAALALLAASCGRAPREVAAPPRPAAAPKRVVTLAPAVTEMLFAMGCGDRIAGTDEYSDYPPAAAALPKVGKMEPDLERIAALRPDLVIGIVAGSHPKLRPALDALHIPLTIVSLERLGEVDAAMQQLGTSLQCPKRDDAIRALHVAINSQRRTRAHPPRVLFLAWAEPLYAAGRDTFVDDLYELAGAKNAVEVRGWPQLSLETLVANPPDLLLYAHQPVGEAQIGKLLARGVRTHAVPVDENLFGRPGPRMANAAAALNEAIDAWEQRR